MTEWFINPKVFTDEELIYWAKHFANRYETMQKSLLKYQHQHEVFLAEVQERGMLDLMMEEE